MSSFKTLSTAVVFLLLGVAAMGANAAAVSSGGIGGRPANPDPNNPRTQSIFILNANKGETKRDVILVANNSDKKQTIELYGVDGVVTNTGSFTCSQESEAKQRMGAWIAVDKTVVTLEPGKTEEVGFSVSMPASADVGEHNGCIVFQMAEDDGEVTGNVRIRTRQAVRVVATVPGNLQRNVEITNFTYGNDGSGQSYTLNLQNTGNVSADVDANVYLVSLFGNTAYENGGGYPVLANQKLDLSFVNEKAPFFGGWYYASAKITYDNRAGSFGVGETKYLVQKETGRQLVFVAPTLAGVVTIFVLVCATASLAVWLVLRRRERLAVHRNWDEYVVKPGDSIKSVAIEHGISWKKLAVNNNIAAPYVLDAGRKIRVPSGEIK